MRRNRKIPKKMSVVATNTMRFGAIIVFFFVMVILNLLSASSCTQLQNAKGALEREIVKLDEDNRFRMTMTTKKTIIAPKRIVFVATTDIFFGIFLFFLIFTPSRLRGASRSLTLHSNSPRPRRRRPPFA